MNKYKWGLLVAAALFMAGPVKVWDSGESITSADLNATISHLHANLGHGHGPVIVNADVATSAAISHSKLATPALVPKAWASITTACATPATCTLVDSSVATGVVGTANPGEYTVSFPTRGDANYGTVVNAFSATADVACHTSAQAATTATVICITPSTGAAVDAAFTFMLLDTSN